MKSMLQKSRDIRGRTAMHIVVLDDYQNVADNFANWQELGAEVKFSRPIHDTEDLVQTVDSAEVVVAMRERTSSLPSE